VTNAAAAAYGPAPRTRPAGAAARPADPRTRLHVVPDPNSEVPTSEPTETLPTETISAGQGPAPSVTDGVGSDFGFRVRAANTWHATRDYWTPPTVFTQQPASLADLAEYAKHAPWAHQNTGLLRTAGISYYRLIGYPYTVTSRYSEWLAQRPGRLVVALGGIKLAAMTGPGIWVVDHLIYPAARLVGHILL
jgi:hypothetical protein